MHKQLRFQEEEEEQYEYEDDGDHLDITKEEYSDEEIFRHSESDPHTNRIIGIIQDAKQGPPGQQPGPPAKQPSVNAS